MLEIEKLLKDLSTIRPSFKDENDFKIELASLIKNTYKEKVTVCTEFCPIFEPNIAIDILVIMDNKWYPIELKYKKKEYIIDENGSVKKKNPGGYKVNHQRYFKDIERIKKFKSQENKYGNDFTFGNGYAIFLTNDGFYYGNATNKGSLSKNIIEGSWYYYSNDNNEDIFKYIINKI